MDYAVGYTVAYSIKKKLSRFIVIIPVRKNPDGRGYIILIYQV